MITEAYGFKEISQINLLITAVKRSHSFPQIRRSKLRMEIPIRDVIYYKSMRVLKERFHRSLFFHCSDHKTLLLNVFLVKGI